MAEQRAIDQGVSVFNDASDGIKEVDVPLDTIHGEAFDDASYFLEAIFIVHQTTYVGEGSRKFATYNRVSGTVTKVIDGALEGSIDLPITFGVSGNNARITVDSGEVSIHAHVFWRLWASKPA